MFQSLSTILIFPHNQPPSEFGRRNGYISQMMKLSLKDVKLHYLLSDGARIQNMGFSNLNF